LNKNQLKAINRQIDDLQQNIIQGEKISAKTVEKMRKEGK